MTLANGESPGSVDVLTPPSPQTTLSLDSRQLAQAGKSGMQGQGYKEVFCEP